MMASQPPFRIVASEVVRRQIRNCARLAERCGQSSDFRKWYDLILAALQSAPTLLGEPRYRFKFMTMTEYHAMRGPIRIVFAVHDSEPIVFVKAMTYFAEYGKRGDEPSDD